MLEVVGAGVEDLLELLGSSAEGRPFLVGSLGAGLGNHRSDIDVHVVTTAPGPFDGEPAMFFLGERIVDVHRFSDAAIAGLLDSFSTDTVPLLAGRCALGAAPAHRLVKRVGRWAAALPLTGDEEDRILDPGRVPVVGATLVRAAVEDALAATRVAMVMRDGGRNETAAWYRAARAIAEVAVRSHGDLYVGTKWWWQKARRVPIDPSTAGAMRSVADETSLRSFAAGVGLALPDIESVVLVEVVDAPRFVVGRRPHALVDGRRLVPLAADGDEPTGEQLFHGLREGSHRLAVDAAAIDSWLTGSSS